MPGSPKKYVIRDILVWARGEGPWRQHAKQQPIDVDPLLGDDSDSDALERYRLAKAKHAELDLEERRKELIERSKCRDALARWASLIRRMGEVLSKRHGVSAAKTVNLTLEECEVIAKGLLGDDSNT
jgi:phage terminase Nu1 subunit (DNA packaging protein)